MKRYELFLSDEDLQGVNCISVVGKPAMETRVVALKANEKKVCFKEVDKKKLTLMGIIMKPNKEIYRFDEATQEEYYVYFSPETVNRVSQLYLKKGFQRNFNVEHESDNKLQGYLTESWIVEDVEKDKSSIYNLGADVGDWVGTLKFESEDEYNRALENGTGFSIEGLFDEKITLKKEDMDFKQMKTELVSELKQLFAKQVKLGQLTSQDGSMTFEFDGDVPTIGSTLFIVTPDGNVPAPIGDYIMADGSTVGVVEVGIIASITPATDVPAEMATPELPTVPDVADLKQAISSMLIKFNEDLETRFSAIETKLSEQKQENEAFKVELSQTPAVAKTTVAPVATTTEQPKTKKARLALSLTQIKNK